MVNKNLLRQSKGKIKTTKKIRDKIKELELEQEIQHKIIEEIPKQIKDVKIKQPIVKLRWVNF